MTKKITGTNTVIINDNTKFCIDLTLEDIKQLFLEYKIKYNKFPNSCICMNKDRDNLPSWRIVEKLYVKNNMTLNDFLLYIGNFKAIKPDITKYDEYIKIIKDQCILQNRTLECRDFLYNNWGVPDSKWLVAHCPNKAIKTYCEFTEWIGFVPKNHVSKERAIKAIYYMSKKYNRALMYSDFKSPKFNEVGIGSINKIWGSMNKMKLELNLEIVQDSMIDRIKPIEEMKSDLIKLCEEIYKKENRTMITLKDIDRCKTVMNSSSYRKYLKLEGSTVRKFIESIGFQLQAEGNGLNHTFEDGERVRSQYELDFSILLRDKLNLQYNIDYTRDVRYKEFIPGYAGLLDCDYIINYNGRKIYIEVAGMLRDGKSNFINNIVIKSKSKEKYRQHLIIKDKMMNDNKLEYYILFPSDLQEDFLLSIFNPTNSQYIEKEA